jgi:hypothetical protein
MALKIIVRVYKTYLSAKSQSAAFEILFIIALQNKIDICRGDHVISCLPISSHHQAHNKYWADIGLT